MGKHDPALQLSGTSSLQLHGKSQGLPLLVQGVACSESCWLISVARGLAEMDLIPTEDAQRLGVQLFMVSCHR